jgi:hypothetical protein
LLERGNDWSGMADDQIRLQLDQLPREAPDPIAVARAPAIFDPDIAPVTPAQVLQGLSECGYKRLTRRVTLRNAHQDADAPDPTRLLRARRERPRSRSGGRSAGEERDELTAFHSITSSAMTTTKQWTGTVDQPHYRPTTQWLMVPWDKPELF